MNQGILTIFYCEFVRWCSYVAFLVPVSLHAAIYAWNQHVMSDIEFSSVVEKWSLNVFLENKSSQFPIAISFSPFHPYNHIIECIGNTNAISTICIFAWLDDPHILCACLALLFLNLLIILFKDLVFGIINTLTDVEGERDHGEGINILEWEISSHIVEQSFLVADVEIIL